MSSHRPHIHCDKCNCRSHEYLSKTRGFEGSRVILGCIHQYLKMIVSGLYSCRYNLKVLHCRGGGRWDDTKKNGGLSNFCTFYKVYFYTELCISETAFYLSVSNCIVVEANSKA